MKLSHSDHLDRKIYLLLRTYKYIYVFGDSMALKQISLTIPDELLKASKEYSKERLGPVDLYSESDILNKKYLTSNFLTDFVEYLRK